MSCALYFGLIYLVYTFDGTLITNETIIEYFATFHFHVGEYIFHLGCSAGMLATVCAAIRFLKKEASHPLLYS